MVFHTRSFVFAALFLCPSLFAVTYVVPTDRDLVRRADAIVIARALESHPALLSSGTLVTFTTFAVETNLKGDNPPTLQLLEPGGSLGARMVMIPGAPRFVDGSQYLLFLHHLPDGHLTTYALGLGTFTINDESIDRGAGGFDERDGSPYIDRQRDPSAFLNFIRAAVKAPMAPLSEEYFVGEKRMVSAFALRAVANAARTDYLWSSKIRWSNDATASFGYCCAPSFEPGFNGPADAITAVGVWSGTGVIHYSVGSATSATLGLQGSDGANTILFNDPNDELSSFGSGIIGLGGVTNTAGVYTLADGVTYVSTQEADVVIAKPAQFAPGTTDSILTGVIAHELGHTLGFRHADGTADPTSPPPNCAAPLPCSSGGQALMESSIRRSTLGSWDVDAANTVYGSGAACSTSVSSISSSANPVLAGQSFTLTANATATSGTLSYQWYRGSLGNTANPIGTGQTVTVTQSAATTYWVNVTSSCGGNAVSQQINITMNTGACGSNANQLCINNARYRVTLTARDPSGNTGQGVALYQSNVFGYFSLPSFTGDAGNPEVFVKIVEFAGRPWVFYAGLTNLDYTLTVQDTVDSAINKQYHVAPPPVGSFKNFGNFDVDGATSNQCDDVTISTSNTSTGTCSANANTLCLLGNRFAVTLFGQNNPTRGTESANGLAVPVNNVFGFFTTPPPLSGDPNDIQAFVKMVDARAFSGNFWVFLGGLTDFRLTFTVTDTQTGQRKTYLKPAGSTCGWNDTVGF